MGGGCKSSSNNISIFIHHHLPVTNIGQLPHFVSSQAIYIEIQGCVNRSGWAPARRLTSSYKSGESPTVGNSSASSHESESIKYINCKTFNQAEAKKKGWTLK